jgi:RNA polymerase sigma factor (sigma-70 family)
MDESNLWREFKSGDLTAYSQIYRKYFFVLFNYGKKISDDHELVKDCIQDLFIKIWSNRENLNDTTSIKYYLLTSLKRKILDHLRSTQQKHRGDEDAGVIEMVPDGAIDEGLTEEQKHRILNAMNRLSEHQQKLLHMKYYKNLSNKEISKELGITIQSVYNAVFKALKSVKKKYIL